MSAEIRHQKVKEVLSRWNPLGQEAAFVEDLNDYDTEALDILSMLSMRGKNASRANIIRDILNDAFGLCLTAEACNAAAVEIIQVEKRYPA